MAADSAALANAEVQYYCAAQLYHTAQISARAAVRPSPSRFLCPVLGIQNVKKVELCEQVV